MEEQPKSYLAEFAADQKFIVFNAVGFSLFTVLTCWVGLDLGLAALLFFGFIDAVTAFFVSGSAGFRRRIDLERKQAYLAKLTGAYAARFSQRDIYQADSDRRATLFPLIDQVVELATSKGLDVVEYQSKMLDIKIRWVSTCFARSMNYERLKFGDDVKNRRLKERIEKMDQSLDQTLELVEDLHNRLLVDSSSALDSLQSSLAELKAEEQLDLELEQRKA